MTDHDLLVMINSIIDCEDTDADVLFMLRKLLKDFPADRMQQGDVNVRAVGNQGERTR